MIYIFKGCQSICELPARCCDALAALCNESCKLCNNACGHICKYPQKAFAAVCISLAHIFDRPLGCYILLALLMNTISIVGAVTGLADKNLVVHVVKTGAATTTLAPFATTSSMPPGVVVCEKPVKMFLIVDILFSIGHIAFSFYIQWSVWDKLCELVDEEEEEAERTGMGARMKRRNVAELIIDSSGNIALRDIGFCLYFFFLIGSFVFSIMGASWTKFPGCNPQQWPGTVAVLGIVFPILVAVFAFNWVIFLCAHAACEHCFARCGGFSCCFGKRPLARSRNLEMTSSDSSDSESYAPTAERQARRPKPNWY